MQKQRQLDQQTKAACRVHGIKRVTKACVGEKHSLALQCWSHAPKQLRLPMLAEAAALPALTRVHTPSPEDADEMLAMAQEDADWTAAADHAAGATQAGFDSIAVPASRETEEQSWLGKEFWQGLEAAHQKIQAAATQEW